MPAVLTGLVACSGQALVGGPEPDAAFDAPVMTCGETQTACGEECVDLLDDPDHCGACDAACAEGQLCVGGMCAVECPAGQIVCGDRCVDVRSDPLHCGACDVACDEGLLCGDGMCGVTCGTLTLCTDEAGSEYCADLTTSRDDCGDCGLGCGPGEVCVDALCEISCPIGQVPCEIGRAHV